VSSGVATILAYPEYFFRLPLQELSKPLEQLRNPPNTNSALVKRSLSVSVLQRIELDANDDDFQGFEKECAKFESHRDGLILSLEQTPLNLEHPEFDNEVQVCRIPTDTIPTRRNKRTQSAPCLASKVLPANVIDEVDAWEDDFTLSDWVVPAVKEKAMKIVPDREIENWDSDFENENEIEIPAFMQVVQRQCKLDMDKIKNFVLHVQGKKAFIRFEYDI
jgi:hypothetical protein